MQHDYEVQLGKDLKELHVETGLPPSRPRVVLAQDGTQRENPYLTPEGGGKPVHENGHRPDVDSLFGATTAYQSYKKEKFEHRLMLWYRLQGMSVKETAELTGYTPQSVSQVCKQPWFREAFVSMAKEFGVNAMQTLIEGAVIPAFQRLEDLAENAKSEGVKLAANKELIDRFLGKTVAKVETTLTQGIDENTANAAKLIEENARIQRELQARGIGQHSTN